MDSLSFHLALESPVRSRGPLYDLDVYLEQGDQGLKPAKLIIHKVDGEKRE